jgi:hypothetical protein
MGSAEFIAYVDESGDRGFVFKEDGSGSTRWFVVSAVVVRRDDDRRLVDCLREVRTVLKLDPKKELHFVDLKHQQRIPLMTRIGKLPIQLVSVLVYKPTLKSRDWYSREKESLYRYCSRLLAERVSRLCREQEAQADGRRCELVFSNRGGMSYDELCGYFRRLRDGRESDQGWGKIDWSVVDPDHGIFPVEHARRAGLQIADAVASATHYAVKVGPYGEVEPAYVRYITGGFYRSSGRVLDAGLKLWVEGNQDELPGVRDLKDILQPR